MKIMRINYLLSLNHIAFLRLSAETFFVFLRIRRRSLHVKVKEQ